MTLVVQMLVFAIFVWFTMRFVWPPLSKAMDERQNKIAEGLASAERGRRELELAQHRIKDELKQAKVQANDIIEKANRRASQMIEEAREEAREEADRQIKLAQDQLQQEVNKAKNELKLKCADLVIAGAERILHREVNDATNKALFDSLIEEI